MKCLQGSQVQQKHQARGAFVAHLSLCPICNVNIKLGDTACKLYMGISPPTNTLIKVLEISGTFAYSSLQDQPCKVWKTTATWNWSGDLTVFRY